MDAKTTTYHAIPRNNEYSKQLDGTSEKHDDAAMPEPFVKPTTRSEKKSVSFSENSPTIHYIGTPETAHEYQEARIDQYSRGATRATFKLIDAEAARRTAKAFGLK